MLPSVNGRRFRSVADVDGGDVGPETVFDYHQQGTLVHGRYEGGGVRLGFLVGVRDGDELDFRYVQLRSDGTTGAGHCRSRIHRLADGRLRLEEAWEWESEPGAGTSSVEEIRDQRPSQLIDAGLPPTSSG